MNTLEPEVDFAMPDLLHNNYFAVQQPLCSPLLTVNVAKW